MDQSSAQYLLAGSASELERLRLQARVREPEAEAILDQIGIQTGWSCIDLGCGAMGILDPLSRRVGASGRVIGVDNDQKQLAAARAYVLVTLVIRSDICSHMSHQSLLTASYVPVACGTQLL
jgi:trans-aconitate methyltransferase